MENHTGADLTGTDGETNRILELANTGTTTLVLPFVSGIAQHSDDITVMHKSGSSTILFKKRVLDAHKIVVLYVE